MHTTKHKNTIRTHGQTRTSSNSTNETRNNLSRRIRIILPRQSIKNKEKDLIWKHQKIPKQVPFSSSKLIKKRGRSWKEEKRDGLEKKKDGRAL